MKRHWVFVAIVTSCLIVASTSIAVGVSYVTRSRPITSEGRPVLFPAHATGAVHLAGVFQSDGRAGLPDGTSCLDRADGSIDPFVKIDIPGVSFESGHLILLATGPNQQAAWVGTAGNACEPGSGADIAPTAHAARIVIQPVFQVTGSNMTCQDWIIPGSVVSCTVIGDSVTLTPDGLKADCQRAGGTVHVCQSFASNLSIDVPDGVTITMFCSATSATFIGSEGDVTRFAGRACA